MLEVDPNVLEIVRVTQSDHQRLIDRVPMARSREEKIRLTDDLIQLRRTFTAQALLLVRVPFPYMLDRADPTQVLVRTTIADLADTERRLDDALRQGRLAKQIRQVSAVGEPPGPPKPKWWWYLVAAGVGALVFGFARR